MENLRQVYQTLIQLSLHPVGITNLSNSLQVRDYSLKLPLVLTRHSQKEAQAIGIPILTVPKGQPRVLETGEKKKEKKEKKVASAEPPAPVVAEPASIELGERREVLSTVRSGQQVYARGPKAQLVILGNVSSGAEVLSDGDIHIHGTLFGRALAGISGDEDSRIYTKSMQAELVAISGLYTSGDSLPDPVEASSLPCMVFISEDQKLSFALASQF
jgi:septum site-determining protein MinC